MAMNYAKAHLEATGWLQPVAVRRHLVAVYGHRAWDSVAPSGNTMDLLKQAGQSHMLCFFKLVSIHASHGDAIQSGLLGPFGEERVVLADAGDDARIRFNFVRRLQPITWVENGLLSNLILSKKRASA